MRRMTNCQICGAEQEAEYDWKCDRCGQEYDHRWGIKLTTEQRRVLLAHLVKTKCEQGLKSFVGKPNTAETHKGIYWAAMDRLLVMMHQPDIATPDELDHLARGFITGGPFPDQD